MSGTALPVQNAKDLPPAKRTVKGFLITLAIAGLSLLFQAPAVIAEVYSWLPKSLLDRTSGSFSNFVGLSEVGVAVGGGFYLILAFLLNVFLLFLRQAPVWLKVLVWVFFVVAVLGWMRVEADIRHSFLGSQITDRRVPHLFAFCF